MSYQTRKLVDTAAKAVVAALNATRKSPGYCTDTATGTMTLISGTSNVSGATGVHANAFVDIMVTTASGTTGVGYKVSSQSEGAFTVTSFQTSNATQTADTSSLTWRSRSPLFHAATSPLSTNTTDEWNPTSTALTVTAASATNLVTSITLANNIRQVLIQHTPDAEAHLVADTFASASTLATTIASDLQSASNLANAAKTILNAHLTQSGVHVLNDSLNANSTTAATDQTTTDNLLNALKTNINAHVGSAPTGSSIKLIGP